MISIVFASLLTASALRAELVPVTFSVSGFSCISCARRVQEKLGKIPELHNVVVTPDDHRARMEIDPGAVPLQRITTVIAGESGKFIPRLLLQLYNKNAFHELKAALESIKGIRYVREPNEKGLMLIDLKKEGATTLREVYAAAEAVRVRVGDAPATEKIVKK